MLNKVSRISEVVKGWKSPEMHLLPRSKDQDAPIEQYLCIIAASFAKYHVRSIHVQFDHPITRGRMMSSSISVTALYPEKSQAVLLATTVQGEETIARATITLKFPDPDPPEEQRSGP